MKKVLVTIGRQYGVGAHDVGKKLAEALGVNYYDNDNMAELMPEEEREYFKNSGESEKADKQYTGYVMKVGIDTMYYYTRNKTMFDSQSELMKSIADKESAVFVGRCADYVLKDYEGLVTVYLGAPLDYRIKMVMDKRGVSEKEAKHIIRDMDKSRETYYNYYTDQTWGERGNYSLCLRTDKISEEAIVNIIKSYVENM